MTWLWGALRVICTRAFGLCFRLLRLPCRPSSGQRLCALFAPASLSRRFGQHFCCGCCACFVLALGRALARSIYPYNLPMFGRRLPCPGLGARVPLGDVLLHMLPPLPICGSHFSLSLSLSSWNLHLSSFCLHSYSAALSVLLPVLAPGHGVVRYRLASLPR